MRIVLLIFTTLFFASCEVEEGKGGRATIQGKVFVDDFNSEGQLIVSDYAPDWDVFIVYGDDSSFSDVTTTHFDGTYKFEYLYEGNYTIYTYSKCNACANNIEPIIMDVTISDPSAVLTLEDLKVID